MTAVAARSVRVRLHMELESSADPKGVIVGMTWRYAAAVRLLHDSSRRPISVESEESTAMDHRHQSPLVVGVVHGPAIAA